MTPGGDAAWPAFRKRPGPATVVIRSATKKPQMTPSTRKIAAQYTASLRPAIFMASSRRPLFSATRLTMTTCMRKRKANWARYVSSVPWLRIAPRA